MFFRFVATLIVDDRNSNTVSAWALMIAPFGNQYQDLYRSQFSSHFLGHIIKELEDFSGLTCSFSLSISANFSCLTSVSVCVFSITEVNQMSIMRISI